MTLEEAKRLIEQAEPVLADSVFTVLHTFERNDRVLTLTISDRLRRTCKRGRVWKSRHMLTALKNAQYGFDRRLSQSSGGCDGIFALSRDYRPANEMMKKIFDRFIDHPKSEAKEIAAELGSSLQELIPVRLVSHHMRLLGLLKSSATEDFVVLLIRPINT